MIANRAGACRPEETAENPTRRTLWTIAITSPTINQTVPDPKTFYIIDGHAQIYRADLRPL
jgi:hypothetical protein